MRIIHESDSCDTAAEPWKLGIPKTLHCYGKTVSIAASRRSTDPGRQHAVHARILGGIIARLAAFCERRAEANQLRCMSDRELTDIGLNRQEIDRAFNPDYIRVQSR